MRRRETVRLLTAVLTIAVLNVNCSTLTFGAIGMLIDRAGSKTKFGPASNCGELRRGDKVLFVLKDGSIRQGRYGGIESLSDQEYSLEYAKSLEQFSSDTVLPALGDTLTVETTYGRRFECTVLGFDFESMLVSIVGQDVIGPVAIGEIKRADYRAGRSIQLDSMAGLSARGRLPCKSVVVLSSEGQSIRVSTGALKEVGATPRKTGCMYAGFALGAVVDVVAWVTFLASWEHAFDDMDL